MVVSRLRTSRPITRGGFAIFSLHAGNLVWLLAWGLLLADPRTTYSSVPLLRDQEMAWGVAALVLVIGRLYGWSTRSRRIIELTGVVAVALWLLVAAVYALDGRILGTLIYALVAGWAFAGYGIDAPAVVLIDETPP